MKGSDRKSSFESALPKNRTVNFYIEKNLAANSNRQGSFFFKQNIR